MPLGYYTELLSNYVIKDLSDEMGDGSNVYCVSYAAMFSILATTFLLILLQLKQCKNLNLVRKLRHEVTMCDGYN